MLERVHIRTRSAFKAEDARELVLSLLDAAEVVAGTYRLELVPMDARDDHVVSAALETAADYLVSVDGRDLQPLKVIKVRGFRPIQIVTPAPSCTSCAVGEESRLSALAAATPQRHEGYAGRRSTIAFLKKALVAAAGDN